MERGLQEYNKPQILPLPGGDLPGCPISCFSYFPIPVFVEMNCSELVSEFVPNYSTKQISNKVLKHFKYACYVHIPLGHIRVHAAQL